MSMRHVRNEGDTLSFQQFLGRSDIKAVIIYVRMGGKVLHLASEEENPLGGLVGKNLRFGL